MTRWVTLLLIAACARDKPVAPAAAKAVRYDQHLSAAGRLPPGDSLQNPYAGSAASVKAGEGLFASMNCDGCHGGGATGWVAPSLSDGRWRYGGSATALYQTIYYGRPKGMPAFGGILAPEIIWKLVTYIQSLPKPASVPTQSYLP